MKLMATSLDAREFMFMLWELMFLTHCRNGQRFRKLLFGKSSFELHSGSKCKDSSNFMLELSLTLNLKCGNHRMASELTFRKILRHIRTFLIPFFRKWNLLKKTLLAACEIQIFACVLLERVLKITASYYCSETEKTLMRIFKQLIKWAVNILYPRSHIQWFIHHTYFCVDS